MSVVASRPDASTAPYSTMPQSPVSHNFYKDPAYGVTIQPVSSRTSSVSSFKTNYSVSTAPTAYSPSSPCSSYRPFDSFASLDKLPESVFSKHLPQKVYDGILNQLQHLHCGPHQSGCVSCFQRDLHSLSLTCRSWEKAVRTKLYVCDIWTPRLRCLLTICIVTIIFILSETTRPPN